MYLRYFQSNYEFVFFLSLSFFGVTGMTMNDVLFFIFVVSCDVYCLVDELHGRNLIVIIISILNVIHNGSM